MNGTPSPRTGASAARKREKTITVTIANTYRTKGEKSRENIASMFGASLLFTLSDPAGGSKIHGPLLPVTPLLKHLLFPQQVRKSFQAIEDIDMVK